MSTTEETVKTETKKFKIDWTTAAGYITTGVIILAMVVLHLCGVVSIKNIDTACKYTQESVKLASISYFTLCKDKFAPEKVQAITNSVLASIKTTTEQINSGKIDLTDAKTAIITQVDKAIDESKTKNPEVTKQLAHIMIDAGFKSIETYSTDIIKDSKDYVKLLNAVSTGIQEGYNVIYPETAVVTKKLEIKAPVKKKDQDTKKVNPQKKTAQYSIGSNWVFAV